MLTKEFIANLRQIVGAEQVSESRADAELYSYDGSLARGTPAVVVFPADDFGAEYPVDRRLGGTIRGRVEPHDHASRRVILRRDLGAGEELFQPVTRGALSDVVRHLLEIRQSVGYSKSVGVRFL